MASGAARGQTEQEVDWLVAVEGVVEAVREGKSLDRGLEMLGDHAASASRKVQYQRYALAMALASSAGRSIAEGRRALPSALELILRGLEAAEVTGYTECLEDAWLRLGEAALEDWRIELAREAYTKCATLAEAASVRAIGQIRLGSIAQHLGRLSEAHAHYDLAAAIPLPGDDDKSKLARGYLKGALGEFRLILGTADVAADLEVAEEEALGKQQFAVVKRQLDFLRTAGRYRDAIDRASAALANPHRLWRPRDLAHLRLLLALAQIELPDEREEGARSLRGMWGSQVPEFAALARIRYATAALDQGDLERARAALDEPLELFGSAIRDAYLLARGRIAIASGDPIPEALERELEDVVDGHIREWDLVEPRPGGVGFLHFERRRAILGLLLSVRVRRHGDGAERAFCDLLRFTDRGSFARRFGLAPGTVLGAHALIPAGGAGVAWLPASFESHVFVLVDGVVHHEFGPGDRGARADCRAFVQALQEGERGAAAQAGGRTAAEIGLAVRNAILPAAAWNRIRTRRALVVWGIDDWGGLPIEAVPGYGQPYLGWSHAICHLPSVAVGMWLRARAHGVVIEEVATTWSLAPPRAVMDRYDVEVIHVADDIRERMLAPLRGALIQTEVALQDHADYQVVVAHGVQDNERDRPAGVYLDGGITWAADLEVCRCAPLVTLLVCGAGRAEVRVGEDSGGHLGAALFVAGATTVLLSDFDLEVASTLELATAFHVALAEGGGLSPAEALRRARLAVGSQARSASALAHASLRVTGLGFDPVRIAAAPEVDSDGHWWWLAVGGVLGSGLLIGWQRGWRRRAPEAIAPDVRS